MVKTNKARLNKVQIHSKLAKHQHRISNLSRKLLSWGILLQQQREYEEFFELAGLGISLEDYSKTLWKIAQSLDEIQLNLDREPLRSVPE